FWSPENEVAQAEHDFGGFQRDAELALWRFVRRGGGLAGRRLLEIGPGRGRDSEAFARAGARLVVSDVSIRSVELARERLRRAGAPGWGGPAPPGPPCRSGSAAWTSASPASRSRPSRPSRGRPSWPGCCGRAAGR